ncbi:hypothetical protein [Rhodothermus marinus]|uniref:hypothetical protein n=1 Tax=Rhodothermus marinus TaxID=29549 RepID=UPI0006D13415|nr:hypothetical protein [Rhodothermus marinus]
MYRLLLLALLGGCSMWAPVLEEPPTIWVAREFSGGRQCSDETYTPPDTRALLAAASVRVYDVWVEPLAVIAVCGAPSYAAIHYARIAEADLERARQLGFEKSDPPNKTPQTE